MKEIDFENEMEDLGIQELNSELDEKINAMIEQAEKEVLDATLNIKL